MRASSVDERRRAQQRLRWHLHELDPLLGVPAGALDRPVWLDRVARKLARREQTLQVRIARELVGRFRSLTRTILELERELVVMTAQTAPALRELPGCGAVTAAKLLAEIGPKPLAPISSASRPKARAVAKRSAASNDNSRASSSTRSKRVPP